MSEARRASDPEGRFTVELPTGWQSEPNEELGGMEIWRDEGIGSLHLISFEGDEEFADPADELYAFLEERGVEIEEDDVDDLALPGAAELALCEYEAEDEDEDDITFWLVAVATAPGVLVFGTYECPAGQQEAERELVRAALGSLRLAGAEDLTTP